MPFSHSLSAIFHKIATCKRLTRTEAEFVAHRYQSLKRSYLATLNRCDDAERGAIALSESQCQVEARRMERDYRLAIRLDEKLNSLRKGSHSNGEQGANGEETGLAYKVCLACYYETQIENMLATQEMPISSEFLSALSELEAALVHLDDVAKTERGRTPRIWAN